MHLDVQDLRNFYYRSALGRVAQKAVRDQMLRMWPEAKGHTVAGYGFAVPLLRPYLAEARRVIALMPGPQGVMPWPAGMPNVSVLSEEVMWPLETGRVDKLVLMHGLESSDYPAPLLEECARVLGPGGKMLIVVPNRTGLWSRSEETPFGYGRPYSTSQIDMLLRDHGFVAEEHATVLYQPPSHRRFWLRAAPVIERIGNAQPMLTGGVLMVVAARRIANPQGGERVPKRRLKVLEGIAEPQPKPI